MCCNERIKEKFDNAHNAVVDGLKVRVSVCVCVCVCLRVCVSPSIPCFCVYVRVHCSHMRASICTPVPAPVCECVRARVCVCLTTCLQLDGLSVLPGGKPLPRGDYRDVSKVVRRLVRQHGSGNITAGLMNLKVRRGHV